MPYKTNNNDEGATYIQVTLDLVHDCYGSKFEKYMRELLPIFTGKDYDWALCIAAKRYSNDPSNGSLSPVPRTLRYLHVWKVLNMNTLPCLMKVFSDSVPYQGLDALVSAETQDFCGPLYPEAYPPPTSGKFLLRLTSHLLQNQNKTEEFKDFMGELQFHSGWKKYRWAPEHVSYSQTGKLRRRFYIWSTDTEHPDAEGAIQWLLTQPKFNQALDQSNVPPLTWELWERVSYT